MFKLLLQAARVAILACVACVPFVPCSSQAQIYCSFTSLTATNYAPVLVNFAVQSNLAYMSLPSRTLVVTNINTNEAITLSYGCQVTGQGGTNVFVLSTLWTNFPASAGWTNGATWIYNVPAAGFSPGVSPWASLGISNAQYTSQSCTNGVLFQ